MLETHDCFQGQLKTEKDLISALDWSHVNPATGPVFVEGARARGTSCASTSARVDAGRPVGHGDASPVKAPWGT